MAIQLGSAYGVVKVKDEVSPNIKTAQKSVEGFGKGLKFLGSSGLLPLAGLTSGAALVTSAVRAMKKSIDDASDLTESRNKVDVVFGDMASTIVKFSETASTALGMSQRDALEAAGTFGNLFDSMGIGKEKTTEMSMGLLKLAADLASFNNIDPTVALEKLRAGLVGEVEPLRTLGVNLSAAAVKVKAVELGIATAGDELSASAKAQAAYALILEQTTNAQGDFSRTADGAANKQRILQATIDDTSAAIGTNLLPAYAKLLEVELAVAKTLNDVLTVTERITEIDKTHAKSVLNASDSYGDYIKTLAQFGVLTGKLSQWQADQIKRMTDSGDATGRNKEIYEEFLVVLEAVSEAEWNQIHVQNAIAEARETSINALKLETGEIETLTGAVDESGEAAERSWGQFYALSGAIRKGAEAASEAAPEMNSLLDGIDRDIDSPIAAFIKDLEFFRAGGGIFQEKFDEIKKALDEGRIAPEEAEQYTKELYIAISDFQEEIGQIDATEAATNISETMGASVQEAKEWIDGTDSVTSALNAVATKPWWINIYYKEHNKPTLIGGAAEGEVELEPGLVPGGAHGLHGFIPPGYPNDSYLVAATSGERVDITPTGQGGGGGETIINLPLAVYGNPSPETVRQAAYQGVREAMRARGQA